MFKELSIPGSPLPFYIILPFFPPAGDGTIASMLRKGWIEQQFGPGGAPQFRITDAGKTAIAAKIPASPPAR
jgi:hypothetical protein